MAANTSTYSFLKPTVGGDTNVWGGFLNSNWDGVDDLLDGSTPVVGIDINGGSIDGTPIGAAAAASGAFTTLAASGAITGVLGTAAQPNITSLGTLSALTLSGTLNGVAATLTGALSGVTGSFSGALDIASDLRHVGDTDTLIRFGVDSVELRTGGSLRADLNNSGMRLGGANARVTTILDQDDLASDSATALATQQSIKAYVDAVTASTGVGVGQTWADVSGSRVGGTSYQNTTGQPIQVAVAVNASVFFQASSDNITWINVGRFGSGSTFNCHSIIPNNWYYRMSGAGSVTIWSELS